MRARLLKQALNKSRLDVPPKISPAQTGCTGSIAGTGYHGSAAGVKARPAEVVDQISDAPAQKSKYSLKAAI
jgi:hypothetical protein